MSTDHQDEIAQIVASIRKIAADSYRRGKEDAFKRVALAAQGELAGKGEFNASAMPHHPPIQDPPINRTDHASMQRPGSQPGVKRATRGSVPKYVYRVLSAPEYQPARWERISESVHALGGTDIAPASVHNYLRSSEKRGEVRRQNGLWFLSQPPWAREGEDRAPTHPGTSFHQQ